MRIEWDPQKAVSNRSKHRVGFEEALTIFSDARVLTVHDPDHSTSEDRWVSIGVAETGRALVVVHAYREEEGDEVVRIISARRASRREISTYLGDET